MIMKNEMFDFYKNALLGSATGTPICSEYKHEWQACGDDKKKLLTFAMRQQCLPFLLTYSYKGMGLSKGYLKREYKDLINGLYTVLDADKVKGFTYGLFVDYNRPITQNMDVFAFMWCGNGNIEIEKTKCPHLYVGCDTTLHVKLNGFNSVRISLFDSSRVVIDDADDESDVVVYRYSDTAKVDKGRDCMADVRVFDKELRLQL